MQTFHGAHGKISEIKSGGMFGGLFSTAEERSAASHGDVLHIITSPSPLTDYELNYEIDGAWEAALAICSGNEPRAESIMTPECELDDGDDGIDGWELQRLRGALAAKLGYTSVEMNDEHGTTWLCLPGCSIELV